MQEGVYRAETNVSMSQASTNRRYLARSAGGQLSAWVGQGMAASTVTPGRRARRASTHSQK